MRVLLDTNVLVAAFAARGLCADVFRHVLSDHELVVPAVGLAELERVLKRKLRMPADTIDEIVEMLREHDVVPKSRKPVDIEIRDPADRWILTAAIDGRADVLVTGDRDLLEVVSDSPVRIVDPRGFWEMVGGGR